MRHAMDVNVHPPTPIKSNHSCESKLKSIGGVLEKDPQLSTKLTTF
jgi:hypothetical protein